MKTFNSFPLSTLPDFAELIIRKLSTNEVQKYREKAKLCSFEEVDVKNLKEWLVVNLGNWFLVRWA